MTSIKYIFILVVSFLFISGCVSELDYDAGDQSFVSINGVITSSAGESIIYISRITGFGEKEEKLSGEGIVYKNGSPEANLSLLRAGELALPITFKVEAGASYHIEITTEENQTYQTVPQTVQPLFRTDSLSFELASRLDGYNSFGVPVNQTYVDVFAHVNLPNPNIEKRFYRWTIDQTWAFKEVPLTPADPVAICYLRKDVKENPSILLSNININSGLISPLIASHPLGEDFLTKHYFNAYLHSIDQRAFEFYEQANRLIENTGNVFDEIPAPIKGNVFNPNDKTDLILGYVEFSKVDTLRLPIRRDQLPVVLNNPCEVPNPCAIRPLPPGVAPPPCKCYACAAVYGFGTLNKPFYWE